MPESIYLQEKIPRLFFKLSLPLSFGLLANFLVQIIDIWFISFLGQNALIAFGFIIPLMMFFVYLSIGLSSGAASIIARKNGQVSATVISQWILNIHIITILIALFVVLISLYSYQSLFKLMGANDQILIEISHYMPFFLCGVFMQIIAMVSASIIRAQGNTKVQGLNMVFSSFLIALLDPIFIFGLGLFEGLGFKGAAIAFFVAKAITALIAIYFNRNALLSGLKSCNPFNVFSVSFTALNHIALPILINNLSIPISMMFITGLLAQHSEYAVAALGIIARIEQLLLIGFTALSAVIGPFMGQNLVMAQFDRINIAIKKICLFSFLYGFTISLSMLILGNHIIRLFSSQSEIIAIAYLYFIIVPISYAFNGISIALGASFNGVGKPLPATIISFCRTLVLLIPFTMISSQISGVKGVFVTFSIVNIICSFMSYFWLKNFITEKKINSLKSIK